MRLTTFRPDPNALPPIGHQRAGWQPGGASWSAPSKRQRSDLVTLVIVGVYVALAVALLTAPLWEPR